MNWLPRPAKGRAYAAPSLLSADFAHLEAEILSMETAGCDLLHLDVMDGHFVPNITFGPFICQAISRVTERPLDAHLMISHPLQYVESFAKAGVDGLTIHVEADSDVVETLQRIGELGVKKGISLNPKTPLEDIKPYLDMVDLVLVMSVQPGFGGQIFDPVAVEKIAMLKQLRQESGFDYLINIDGGINHETGPVCRDAGADILVSGSWLFGAKDRAARMKVLQG